MGFLAAADVAGWPAEALAGCLRALGRAESAQLAAWSPVMSAFNAAGGAAQADLGMLAQQTLGRSAPPDADGADGGAGDDDGFRDRRVWLDLHFRGAGKPNGDLAPECAAALTAMLGALRKKADPRTTPGPPRSAATTPWRKRAGGWSPGACPTRLDC
jgi:hypothetical protein